MKRVCKAALITVAYISSIVAFENLGIPSLLNGHYDAAKRKISSAKESLMRLAHDNPEEASRNLLESLVYYESSIHDYGSVLRSLAEKLGSHRTEEQREKDALDFLSSHPEAEQQILIQLLSKAEGKELIVADLYEEMNKREIAATIRYGLSLMDEKDYFVLSLTNGLSPEAKKILLYKVNHEYFDGLKENGRQLIRDVIREVKR